jgi:hypothetical protein
MGKQLAGDRSAYVIAGPNPGSALLGGEQPARLAGDRNVLARSDHYRAGGRRSAADVGVGPVVRVVPSLIDSQAEVAEPVHGSAPNYR